MYAGDIRSNALGALAVVSNFARHAFTLDGITCGGMEGFLQGLKHEDVERQKQVCAMYGFKAKKAGRPWKDVLFWKGKPVKRRSREYAGLVGRAYVAMAAENKEFRDALEKLDLERCTHKTGAPAHMKDKSVLTEEEFMACLKWIKGKL
jgi:hypothetical protein